MTKKHTSIDLATIEFYGDLNESIKLLNDYKIQYGKDYDRLYLDGGMETYPYGDHDGHYVLRLKGTRLENDAEYEKRLADDAAYKAKRDAREKEQYEVLRKKFEGT